MVWAQILGGLGKAAPKVVKQLPKLWPLLLESNNRARVLELMKELASQSPAKKVRARVELTAVLADEMARTAKTDEQRAQAEAWADRSRNLTLRLDMPVAGKQAKARHRASVRRQLEALQAEMDGFLEA